MPKGRGCNTQPINPEPMMRGSLKLVTHPVARETETVGNLTARGGRLRVCDKSRESDLMMEPSAAPDRQREKSHSGDSRERPADFSG